jgi:ubiquinone/menaquinone biosynthesis C-methylase UbiE
MRAALKERLSVAISQEGINVPSAKASDIARFDQMHTRGLASTRELAEIAGFQPGMEILDIGCGLGGPARVLAEEYGCLVRGIDYNEEYVHVGNLLSKTMGSTAVLDHGSALDLPYQRDRFDGVLMQHVSMAVSEKLRLFQEVERVLSPEGTFAFHEILSIDGQHPAYPTPWAAERELSHLQTKQEFLSSLSQAGLTVVKGQETDREAAAFFEKALSHTSSRGLSSVFGPQFPTMVRNVLQGLQDKKITIVMGAAKRSSQL